MSNILSDELKKVFLAGIGAVASTAERSKELIDELVKKGELTIDQGKVLNEELKHNIKSVIKDNAPSKCCKEKKSSSIIDDIDKLSPEEIELLKAKLSELEKPDTEETDNAEE